MGKIITQRTGREILFDDCDADVIGEYSWSTTVGGNTQYAISTGKSRILMHRLILVPYRTEEVDHIDGNGLNNIRANIRICTHSQNLMNKFKRGTFSSKYKGVYWDKERNSWRAECAVDYIRHRGGRWEKEELAAIAYNEMAKRLFRNFCNLNIVPAEFYDEYERIMSEKKNQ